MRIQGFENYSVSSCGKVINEKTGRILKPDITKYGYARFTLSENNRVKRVYGHQLVALHYIPNPERARMINHKNGIKTDNNVENLEWCSCKANTIHAFDTGLRKSGELSYQSKLSNETVINLCKELSKGLQRNQILKQEQFQHVSKSAFDSIRCRKSWKRVSQNYKWRKSNDYLEREYS